VGIFLILTNFSFFCGDEKILLECRILCVISKSRSVILFYQFFCFFDPLCT